MDLAHAMHERACWQFDRRVAASGLGLKTSILSLDIVVVPGTQEWQQTCAPHRRPECAMVRTLAARRRDDLERGGLIRIGLGAKERSERAIYSAFSASAAPPCFIGP